MGVRGELWVYILARHLLCSAKFVLFAPNPPHTKNHKIRKPSTCSGEVVRFRRPTRQRNARKGGQGRMKRKYHLETHLPCESVRANPIRRPSGSLLQFFDKGPETLGCLFQPYKDFCCEFVRIGKVVGIDRCIVFEPEYIQTCSIAFKDVFNRISPKSSFRITF